METSREFERIGIEAIKKLRRNRLSQGNYFMINLNSLPSDQCYLEYPDGIIKLAVYESDAKHFTIVRELENDESSSLRRKLNLELIRF